MKITEYQFIFLILPLTTFYKLFLVTKIDILSHPSNLDRRKMMERRREWGIGTTPSMMPMAPGAIRYALVFVMAVCALSLVWRVGPSFRRQGREIIPWSAYPCHPNILGSRPRLHPSGAMSAWLLCCGILRVRRLCSP